MYENIGHRLSFLLLTLVYLLLLLLYIAINFNNLRNKSEDITDDKEQPITDESTSIIPASTIPTSNRALNNCLRYCPITFAYIQIFFLSFCFRWAVATTPNWLQMTRNITVTKTGWMLSVSSLINTIILSIVIVCITSNALRWVTLVVFTIVGGIGMFSYPFVLNPFFAILTETAIRSSNAVSSSLGRSLIYRIVDVCEISNYQQSSTFYFIATNSGKIIGSILGPVVVDYVGFDVSCWGLGVSQCLIPIVQVSVSYRVLW